MIRTITTMLFGLVLPCWFAEISLDGRAKKKGKGNAKKRREEQEPRKRKKARTGDD